MFLVLVISGCNRKPKNADPPLAPTEIVTDTVIKRTVPKANNSLAYLGFYQGNLPCNDCQGVETSIILSEDFTYSLIRKYNGKKHETPSEQSGTYSWTKDGTAIILDNVKQEPNQYLVGEKTLTQLDINGNPFEGGSAARYILKKMPELEVLKTQK